MSEPGAPTPESVAARVVAAVEGGDLAAFADLLDPNVRWGAADDLAGGCQNRDQVLAWYQRGWDAGVRAKVTEVVGDGEKILVGLDVPGGERRWQVVTLTGGRVVDIRVFENRDDAARRVPGAT